HPVLHSFPTRRSSDLPDTLALVDLAVVQVPQFRALVFWVPAVVAVTEGINALLGAGFLLIAARTAEGCVETVLVQRLLERLRLQDRKSTRLNSSHVKI